MWSRYQIVESVGAPAACPAQPVAGEPDPVIGIPWLITVRNTDANTLQGISGYCEYPPADPPPPPPPTPPTPGQVLEAEREIVELDTGMSPSAERRGVSQLETWFWCDGDAPITLALSVGGYAVDASVGLDRVEWVIDGPDGVIVREAETCGTEPAVGSDGEGAAARWTPNEPGVSTVQLHAWWSGSWWLTYTYPGLTPLVLGPFDLVFDDVTSEPVSYEVYEIQSVGVGP